MDEARDPPPAYQSESDAFHLETLRSEIEDAPASRQLPSGDRHVSILNKLRAATRLMGALVRRHVEHDRADSTASEPTKEDRELDARLAAARRRRDEAQHAYEDEVRRSGPRPGS